MIDFIFEDLDFALNITREELFKINEEYINNFINFLEICKNKLGNKKIVGVEIVGGLSRMYDLKIQLSKVIYEKLGIKNMSCTLNCDEGVSKGAVLKCAIFFS